MIEKIQDVFEKRAFGVCSWLGDLFGVDSSRIRLYFIYLSFVTLGSPLIIYLVVAFVLDHRSFLGRRRRRTFWDL
ncbi:MAG: PspC domain-containing protein [Flavobacteriales bacterium]|nr:PspC domain-containing protein [Flavobacteriales bacterium]